LVEETGVFGENHWLVTIHWQTLSHNVVSDYTSPWTRFELTTLIMIGTDCTGNCKSKYHAITTTRGPFMIKLQMTNQIDVLLSLSVPIQNQDLQHLVFFFFCSMSWGEWLLFILLILVELLTITVYTFFS
jgi:hypothetical protein